MANISIKDLPENVELDRQAMQAIVGGARFGSRRPFPAPRPAGSRLIHLPGSLNGNAGEHSAPGKAPK